MTMEKDLAAFSAQVTVFIERSTGCFEIGNEIQAAAACMDVSKMRRGLKAFQKGLRALADSCEEVAVALPDLPASPEAN